MMMPRLRFYYSFALIFTLTFVCAFFYHKGLWSLIITLPLFFLGLYDILQKQSNILRNYPLWGHFRYLLFAIRPQIQAYFIETNQSGRPFNREQMLLVQQRATGTDDYLPFGTQLDVDAPGYEWINHSMSPKKPKMEATRLVIGGPQCRQPHDSSRLNISSMSFGAISPEAIRALNRGAKLGNFLQSTGEGGLSKYHLMEGGDLTWQIGTGFFGCRTPDGKFNPETFKTKSRHPNVKMIEIKISQGAKPSHGAILPGEKVSAEIAEARDVPVGQDCLSPAMYSNFSTPIGLLEFVQQLRELCGGKPVGFKLCIGLPTEFMSIVKAMLKTGIYPDFITIDGSEGGTGAAPVEFSDYVGYPLNEGLVFAHNCLVGANLRQHIRLVASGKIITGFDMLCKMALGADVCNMARGMMFAIGCVQSRRCHTNKCPTGITTQDPRRRYALNVDEKAPQVARFHDSTLKNFLSVLGAAGLEKPEDLSPQHIHRWRNMTMAENYAEIFHYLKPGDLVNGIAPIKYRDLWEIADPEYFAAPRGRGAESPFSEWKN